MVALLQRPSIFESADVVLLAAEELFSDPQNNNAMFILLAQNADAELHACIAHVTATQM